MNAWLCIFTDFFGAFKQTNCLQHKKGSCSGSVCASVLPCVCIYVVYTKHLKPSRTNIICSFRPTFILRLLFKEPQPAATSRRVHFPLPHSLSLSLSVRLPLAFSFPVSFFFCLPMNIIVKVNEFFSVSVSCTCTRASSIAPSLTLSLAATPHSRLSRILSVSNYIFFYGVADSLMAASRAVVDAIKFQLLLHFSHTTRAECHMLHAASCMLRRCASSRRRQTCEMPNGKWKIVKMPNAKWEMEQKPFWLAKS